MLNKLLKLKILIDWFQNTLHSIANMGYSMQICLIANTDKQSRQQFLMTRILVFQVTSKRAP